MRYSLFFGFWMLCGSVCAQSLAYVHPPAPDPPHEVRAPRTIKTTPSKRMRQPPAYRRTTLRGVLLAPFQKSRTKPWWQWTLGALVLGLSIWFPPVRMVSAAVRGAQQLRALPTLRYKKRGMQLVLYIGVFLILMANNLVLDGEFFRLAERLFGVSVVLLGATLILRTVRYLQNTRPRNNRIRREGSMVLPSARDAERELQNWNLAVVNLVGLSAVFVVFIPLSLTALTKLLLVLTVLNLLFLVNRYVRNRGREKIARADTRRIRVRRNTPPSRPRPQPPAEELEPRPPRDLPKPTRKSKYRPPTPDHRMQNLSVVAMVLGVLFLIFMLGN